jgi:hypothetical protein
MTKAKTGVMHVETKEHQRLPSHQKLGNGTEDSLHVAGDTEDTLISYLKPPDL